MYVLLGRHLFIIVSYLLPPSYYPDDWSDNARDVLHFLLYYMPEEIERAPSGEATVLPTHLSRLRDTVASRRRENGYSSRTLAAIGHSFGGCSVYVLKEKLFIFSRFLFNVNHSEHEPPSKPPLYSLH